MLKNFVFSKIFSISRKEMTHARSSQKSPKHSHSVLSVPVLDLKCSISNIKPFASPPQLRLLERLVYFLDSKSRPAGALLDVSSFALKLAGLGLTSGKSEIKFFFEIIEDLLGNSLLLTMIKNHSLRIHKEQLKSISPKEKNLPKSQDLRASIRSCQLKNRHDIAWFLILLFISGRRGKDLKRITVRKIQKLSTRCWEVTVPKDKKNNRKILFNLDFDLCNEEWCGSGPDKAGKDFECWLKSKKGKLFDSVCLSNLGSSTLNFTPHQLRSVRALILTLEGNSDSQVMDKIGWKDPQSLLRYRKLPGEQIKGKSREELWKCIGYNDTGNFF